jgi:hypothetical protein
MKSENLLISDPKFSSKTFEKNSQVGLLFGHKNHDRQITISHSFETPQDPGNFDSPLTIFFDDKRIDETCISASWLTEYTIQMSMMFLLKFITPFYWSDCLSYLLLRKNDVRYASWRYIIL